MFYSRKISFRPAGGALYRRAVIDVSLEREHVTVRVFRNEARRIALEPKDTVSMAVRSEPYEADPIPALEAIVDACLGDLEAGRFIETPRHEQTSGPSPSTPRRLRAGRPGPTARGTS